MPTSLRSSALPHRLCSLSLALAAAATALAPREAAAEVTHELAIGAMARAWWATTISMPPTTALLEPRVVQAPPHREAEVITAAVQALEAPAPVPPPQPVARAYPEAVILRALRHGDRAFGRCWRRARHEAIDPPRKTRLHLEVDAAGVVRAARAGDADVVERGAELLAGCIARVGRGLPFPALGQPVKLSLLLLH